MRFKLVLIALVFCSTPAAGTAEPALASPSPEQVKQLVTKMASVRVAPDALKLWQEATPRISEVTLAMSCYTGELTPRSFLRYVDPDTPNVGMALRTVINSNGEVPMPYHPKSRCVSVSRIDNVTALAKNALSFRVTYESDDSGEIAHREYKLRRDADGTWFYRAY